MRRSGGSLLGGRVGAPWVWRVSLGAWVPASCVGVASGWAAGCLGGEQINTQHNTTDTATHNIKQRHAPG